MLSLMRSPEWSGWVADGGEPHGSRAGTSTLRPAEGMKLQDRPPVAGGRDHAEIALAECLAELALAYAIGLQQVELSIDRRERLAACGRPAERRQAARAERLRQEDDLMLGRLGGRIWVARHDLAQLEVGPAEDPDVQPILNREGDFGVTAELPWLVVRYQDHIAALDVGGHLATAELLVDRPELGHGNSVGATDVDPAEERYLSFDHWLDRG